jgi:Na+/melibiose symporter-like transporter
VSLSVAGLVSLTYGFIEAGENGWSFLGAWALIAAGTAVIVAFFAWERRLNRRPGGQPLLDLGLFRSKSYLWGVILAAVLVLSMMGALFTMPQYFQGVLGTTAIGSGLRLLPLIGGLVLGAVPAAQVVRLVGAKVSAAIGFAVLCAGLIIATATSVSSSGDFVALWMAITGLGMGIAMTTTTSAALSELSQERAGVGSAALQALNKVGGPLGSAVLGSVLTAAYLGRLDLSGVPAPAAAIVRQSVFSGVVVARQLGSTALLESVRTAFVHGMDLALAVAAGIALGGVLLSLAFLPRGTVPDKEGLETPEGEVQLVGR